MASTSLSRGELDELLTDLFHSMRSYKVILQRLRSLYGIRQLFLFSLRWLKGQYARLGLRRRCHTYTSVSIVANCIMRELNTSNETVGYRTMWRILKDKYGLQVKRSTVMLVMRQIDPVGVLERARHRIIRRVYISRGPNFAWHVDQYDKLSTFGFFIHGCIDGFSRKIIWLTLASTNRDPAVTLGYFLESISTLNGGPRVIRFDHGVENSLIAEAQIALRMNHSDNLAGAGSVRFGSSPTNSRIESWWSKLRILKIGWWISSLKNLQQDGYYDPQDIIHRKCLAVVLVTMLEQELSDFVAYWNSHRIRRNRSIECPTGIPEDMFDMPEEFEAEDYRTPITSSIYNYYFTQLRKQPPPFFNEHFYTACNGMTKARFNVDLHRDVTHTNWIPIYKFLINNVHL